jgi:uncharacterized protein YdeI (YjbR/CyaY-like superfamily)
VRFFASPAELREWLDAHHEFEKELNAGFHRQASGRASVTWPEAVDEALCVGWIDGVRHGIDDERYRIRFTPRKRGSNWSRRNVERVAELTAQREETRRRRLATLIEDCANRRPVGQFATRGR